MIRITVSVADNVYEPNGILEFKRDRPSDGRHGISAISFACRPATDRWGQIGIDPLLRGELDREVAEYVQGSLLQGWGKQTWVFLRTNWQPRSRITSHLRLWGHLKTQARTDLRGFKLGNEVQFERDQQVCYAGLMQTEVAGLPEVVEIFRSCGGFGILTDRSAVASEESAVALFESAWSQGTWVCWQRLAECLCPLGDVVLRLPPITDIPPHAYESALDLFLLRSELENTMVRLHIR